MQSLEVIHLNSTNGPSGAARASWRIHQSLLKKGVSSDYLIGFPVVPPASELCMEDNFSKVLLQLSRKSENFLLKRFETRVPYDFSIGFPDFFTLSRLAKRKDRVLHLHWINRGFLGLRSLRTPVEPIVWTLHDMWPITGGCHYSFECQEFKRNCAHCPGTDGVFAKRVIEWSHHRKSRCLRESRIAFVVPSKWLAKILAQSSILSSHHVEVIPNPIDVKLFRPIQRSIAREILGLPQSARILMFCAEKPGENVRKGLGILKEALRLLKQSETKTSRDLLLIVLGNSQRELKVSFPYPAIDVGFVGDELSMMMYYNAADVYVHASIADNSPNTVVESLSCGTPVVGFDIGGVRELISINESAFLANSVGPEPLHDAIRNSLAASPLEFASRMAVYEAVVRQHSFSVIADRYISIYDNLLNGTRRW